MQSPELILMAVAVPRKKLISQLQEAIKEFERVETDYNKHKCLFYLHLLMINLITNGNVKEGIEMIKEVGDMEKMTSFFKTNKN